MEILLRRSCIWVSACLVLSALSPPVLELETRLPLSAAAAALGVSPADLRRACRPLGVRRWRHRAHAAAAAAAASPVARTVAYAANLRRRYALLASESLAQPPLTRPTPTSPIPARAAG